MLNVRDIDRLLLEAKKIGETIIHSALKTENGWYWNVSDFKGNIEVNASFYNGNSGIIYYLLELYKATNDEKYYDAALCGAAWIMTYKYNEGEKNLAIYCGIGGIIYVFTELYKINKNATYINFALQLAFECKQSESISDILYGTSGSILTLLHLHNETDDVRVLQILNEKIDLLLNAAIFPKTGICWDRAGVSIHPLCGFAHGNSGVAFVFIELYRYFKNDFFLFVAEMAYKYEDQYFQKNKNALYANNNWPDLRKDIFTQETLDKLIKSFLSNDIHEFVSPSYMSAWCHGAPGIGMSRLHAYDVTKKKIHLKYSKYAIQNTLATINIPSRNYTLCHGILGNAHLLIDAYVVLNNKDAYLTAINMANNSIIDNNDNGGFISGISKTGALADCNLLNGLSGIGHFYLRLINPTSVSSVLLPKITKVNNSNNILSVYDDRYFANILYKFLFRNSSLSLNLSELPTGTYANINSKTRFLNTIKKCIENKNEAALNNSLAIDMKIAKLYDYIKSDIYIYIKKHVNNLYLNKQKVYELSLEEIVGCRIKVSSNVYLVKQTYSSYKLYTILLLSPDGNPVHQFTVSKSTFELLSSIKYSTSELLYERSAKIRLIMRENILTHKSILKNQLISCLRIGFLEFV